MILSFEIGEKVTWFIGQKSNPIVLRGLFLEKISNTQSRVLCYEQNRLQRKAEIEVETELLKRDNGRN